MPTAAAWAAVAAAVIGPFLSFIVASRRMSGRIETTDADQLWEEAREIRKDYARQVGLCRKENADLRANLQTLRKDNVKLREENGDLRKQVTTLKTQVAELMEQR
jgi:hypothetical protein